MLGFVTKPPNGKKGGFSLSVLVVALAVTGLVVRNMSGTPDDFASVKEVNGISQYDYEKEHGYKRVVKPSPKWGLDKEEPKKYYLICVDKYVLVDNKTKLLVSVPARLVDEKTAKVSELIEETRKIPLIELETNTYKNVEVENARYYHLVRAFLGKPKKQPVSCDYVRKNYVTRFECRRKRDGKSQIRISGETTGYYSHRRADIRDSDVRATDSFWCY